MRSIAGKIPLHEHKTEISPPQSSKARIQRIFWTLIFSRSGTINICIEGRIEFSNSIKVGPTTGIQNQVVSVHPSLVYDACYKFKYADIKVRKK
jgi:hypothetical protein